MKTSRLRVLLIATAASLAMLVPSALAQTVGATTGAIDGTLTDGTGGTLPGVTVTVAGATLMLPRTTVTTEDGTYRVTALPPGSYDLSASPAGFQPVARRNIRVSVGATATVNLALDVAAHAEAVRVDAGARVVDRRATTIASAFDAEELGRLPGARTMGAILAATPAVQLTRFDVGGSTAFTTGPFSVYGTAGYNHPTIEGINVSNLNPLAFGLDYGTFADVVVGTGGYGPEWGSPGLHMQFVAKSGGDRYAGSLYAGYEREAWQSHNIDERQIEQGAAVAATLPARDANRLLRYRDLNADVGGFLVQDRLWWYSSAREQSTAARQVIFPIEPLETRASSWTGKATWRLNDGHQLMVFGQSGRNRQPIRLNGFLRGASARNTRVDSTLSQLAKGLVWKGEWSAAIGTSLFLDVRAGQFTASRAERPNGSSPRTEDSLRPTVRGGNRDWAEEFRNDQANGTLSFFRRGPAGHHQFKIGIQLYRVTSAETWHHAYPGDVLHVTANGQPSEVYLFQTPSRSESGLWRYAAHVADTWQLGDRLTVNLGVRVERFRIFLPEQHHPAGRFSAAAQHFAAVRNVATWNAAAPRIGASYDLSGDGRTILKVGSGFYWLPPGTDLGFTVNPNDRVWWERFRWADANGDGLWQRGEEFDPQERRGGQAIDSIDPRLKLAYVMEVTGRIEREAAPGLVIGTGVIWRGERQQGARQRAYWPYEAFSVPFAVRDPGPDAETGTADDGADLRLFQLRPEFLGESQIVVRNPPHADSSYLTWEALARRRLTRTWSLLASFAHTWNSDHAREYFGQVIRGNEFPITPNDFVNTDAGGRHIYRDWSARIYGTWEGPGRVRITPLLRHQSGQAFGRVVTARLNYGDVPVLVEPVGTRRQRHVTVLDLRMETGVRFAARTTLTPFVEVFNALNVNPEQNLSWETFGPFLRPIAIVPPRIARIGFTLDW